jgi:hypothetical protein
MAPKGGTQDMTVVKEKGWNLSSPYSNSGVLDTDAVNLKRQKIYCLHDYTKKLPCFAASETVLLESGEQLSIADVKVGDRVLVASVDKKLHFVPVVSLPHGKNSARAAFITLTLENGGSLKMTPDHLLPVSSHCQLPGQQGKEEPAAHWPMRRADSVSIGHCVLITHRGIGRKELEIAGPESTYQSQQQEKEKEEEAQHSTTLALTLMPVKVMAATLEDGFGFYSIVTSDPSGLVVVNNVVASSFGTNHWLPNTFYTPHRYLFNLFGLNEATSSPISPIASRILHLFTDLAGSVSLALLS